jgi:hypothetical protein
VQRSGRFETTSWQPCRAPITTPWRESTSASQPCSTRFSTQREVALANSALQQSAAGPLAGRSLQMTLFILKLTLTPLLIVVATLAARRWGPAVGG